MSTHSEVDRSQELPAAIREGAEIFAFLHNHYSRGWGKPQSALQGKFVDRADRSSWNRYSFDQVADLPVFGDLARVILDEANSESVPALTLRWRQGVFGYKADEVPRPLDESHLVGVQHLFEVNNETLPVGPQAGAVYEIGLGLVYSSSVSDLALDKQKYVVLRTASVDGEEVQAVRQYESYGRGIPDLIVASHEIPEAQVCFDFLQLARNAGWNIGNDGA